jgi:hypothetical protein
LDRLKRSLTDEERALLEHLLQIDRPGMAALRIQAPKALVVESPDVLRVIRLYVPRDAPPATEVPPGPIARATSSDLDIIDADVTLWIDGDYLGSIEISCFENEPNRLPRPNELEPPTRM